MKDADIHETLSAHPFETTLERLMAAIAQAGLILFSRIDHQAGAQAAGLEMPPAGIRKAARRSCSPPLWPRSTFPCACSSGCGATAGRQSRFTRSRLSFEGPACLSR
jgi:hypothetical protein